jgi:hypothetical protein
MPICLCSRSGFAPKAEDNFRARRTYEKAGFQLAGSAATEAGPVVLMVDEPDPPRVS